LHKYIFQAQLEKELGNSAETQQIFHFQVLYFVCLLHYIQSNQTKLALPEKWRFMTFLSAVLDTYILDNNLVSS